MKFRSAFAVLSMTVALTACGELPFQGSDEPEVPAHSGPPTVSPLEAPIETGTEGTAISTAEATTMNTAIFRAMGSGWAVTAGDKLAVYERPGQRSTGVTVRRMTYGRGVEFIGTMNGSVFSLNIRAAECQTGDGTAPFTAQLRVGSQRLTGCAAPTDSVPQPQVRASSAAPKPRTTPAATRPAQPAPAATETAPAPTSETTTPATPTPATEAPAAETAPATPAPAATVPETVLPPAPTAEETPAVETPAVETPAAEPATPAASATETPAAETPAPQTPAPETPATPSPAE
ncbi:hypothetical protein [Paracoccus shanxieyensis]|uniref:Uncharacterized protein n=1 Tax=Paracoccus shanxieyensis TaxID=2675752 RepID=A0A6L6IZM3_9RHOB|nr:hypothetical protein [Paracoccus shanxieyensis]MTH64612.1 hypothetical protein [Paracoccus shanxieyensis]MTH87756.1 hypothetical protein [Paracoccus shanxieyensis]